MMLALVAALLALIALLVHVTGVALSIQIATISFAMGILNNAATRIGAQSVNVAFVTGTLARFGNHAALAWRRTPLADATGPFDTHAHRAGELAGIWTAFLVGALAGGVATPRLTTWTLVPPTAALLALSLVDRKAAR
jgi:uncharacterized membrane protein YoaK (UPF0700 family)